MYITRWRPLLRVILGDSDFYYYYYYYYCFFYSQKELGFAKSYLHFFLEKAINRLVRPVQKNNIKY